MTARHGGAAHQYMSISTAEFVSIESNKTAGQRLLTAVKHQHGNLYSCGDGAAHMKARMQRSFVSIESNTAAGYVPVPVCEIPA